MEWFFDGLGTMLIGLVIGAGGTGIAWKISSRRTSQRQKGGNGATQIQAGRDAKNIRNSRSE